VNVKSGAVIVDSNNAQAAALTGNGNVLCSEVDISGTGPGHVETGNGTLALEHATKACELSGWKRADYLDTHAEGGNFDEAVRWQKKALAIGFPDRETAESARRRLKRYEDGKPYREADGPESVRPVPLP
jgi:hypothetical protein